MANRGSSFAAIAVAVTIIVIIGVAAFSVFVLNMTPFQTQTTTTTQTSQTSCSPSGCVLPLPIAFKITALYSSAPISTSGSALTVLKPGSPATSFETGDTNSSGVWVTTKTYAPDTSWFLYFNYGNAKYEFKFTVPRAQAATDKTLPVHLIVANIGSYSISVLAPDGTTNINPTTGNYNVTSAGNNHPSFTVTITNSIDNTGFVSSFDRYELVENNQPRHLVANAIVITTTGKARVVGQTGNAYVLTLPDHATDRQRNPDGTLNQNAQGKYSTIIQFDTTMMTQGSTGIITISYYAYFDSWYYDANGGVVNSEAYLAASFIFSISA